MIENGPDSAKKKKATKSIKAAVPCEPETSKNKKKRDIRHAWYLPKSINIDKKR